jgi:hypothetical protein
MSVKDAGPLNPVNTRTKYETNPLLLPEDLEFDSRTVKVGKARDLIDKETGETHAVNAIYQKKIVDSERFAKVYHDGIARMFGLSKTAMRLFQVILTLLTKDTDKLYLSSQAAAMVDKTMIERTYHRGLKELIERRFLAYTTMPNMFWINPHILFNGNRVAFIEEYVRSEEAK